MLLTCIMTMIMVATALTIIIVVATVNIMLGLPTMLALTSHQSNHPSLRPGQLHHLHPHASPNPHIHSISVMQTI